MKEQLSELLKGLVFKFDLMSEGIASFVSTVPKDINGNYCLFKIEIFYNDSNFFCAYNTFDELIDMHQLFMVFQYAMEEPKNKEILFSEQYIEPNK